jgi:hypothetical protein
MVSMSDELKERNVLKLISIMRFACAALDVGHPIFYVQPLSRPNKCLALHVVQGTSERATESVQNNLNHICERLS